MEFHCRLVTAAGEIVEGTYAAESEARLRHDFELTESPLPETSMDFLGSIKRELEIEARGEGQRPIGRTP